MGSTLVVCTQEKDHDELEQIRGDNQIIYTDFDGSVFEKLFVGIETELPSRYEPDHYLQYIHQLCDEHKITSLLNTCDYPGALFTSILAQERNLAAPSLASILSCQHKYYARLLQKKYVPTATPDFALIKIGQIDQVARMRFPLFVKPIKSYLSVFAKKVNSKKELKDHLERSIIPEPYLRPFNWAIKKYSPLAYDDGSYFIAEELLEGRQVTLEGLVCDGRVTIIGIVDSHLHEGTLSFERFVFPSDLPSSVQKHMSIIAKKIMKHIGFNHNLFNIEFMYNPVKNTIHIIEINPRMSAQFCDLYAMVHGQSNYQILYDLIMRRKLEIQKEGKYALAASLVCREWNDQRIKVAPTQADLKKAQQRFSELRYYPWMSQGKKLSDVIQDGTSYVYCWIHLGAQNMQELDEKYEEAKQLLPYKFEPI